MGFVFQTHYPRFTGASFCRLRTSHHALARWIRAKSEGRDHPGLPGDKAQRNFTGADSRIMPGPGGRDFQQAYNCQAVVDSVH